MEDKHQFAGFWKRVGAYLIDYIIVLLGVLVLSFGMGLVVGLVLLALGVQKDTVRLIAGVMGMLLGLSAFVFYWALFECSSKQATPGKMALGIVVTDTNGGRISFGRSIGRQFARFLSGLVLGLGYIICGFTERRQCVHDLLAGTLVVNKDAPLRIGAKDGFQIMQAP
jgi:uncharacterized RDD family membrane protein YckC